MANPPPNVVILAGGRGERLWPVVRAAVPKHTHGLGRRVSQLQDTVRRARWIAPGTHVWVVTERAQRRWVNHLLGRERGRVRIIEEPVGRNTAAAVGLAATLLAQRDPSAVMVVLPTDHWIRGRAAFVRTLRQAMRLAREQDQLVLLGVRPRGPSSAYGYLRLGGRASPRGGRLVTRFIEKPSPARARGLLRGRAPVLWNSGIFVWTAHRMLEALRAHAPDLARGLAVMAGARSPGDLRRRLDRVYPTLRAVSVDIAVLERARGVAAVPARFGWWDVGSWAGLWDALPRDRRGNAARGLWQGVDTAGTLVSAEAGHLVATVGVRDLVIIQTREATLVCSRARAEEVRRIVRGLPEHGLMRYV